MIHLWLQLFLFLSGPVTYVCKFWPSPVMFLTGMQAYLDMMLSGLSAPLPRIVSATLRALASALFNFSEDMGLEVVQGLLEKAAEQMLNTNREIVTAALSFLKVIILIINHTLRIRNKFYLVHWHCEQLLSFSIWLSRKLNECNFFCLLRLALWQ